MDRIDPESNVITNGDKFDRYKGKCILAPMVRANSLPFRLLCLKMGADLVFTEELIDHRLCESTRVPNISLGTIDYVDKRGAIVLRVIPEEKPQLVMQIGSNCPERALKAAKLVSQDISGLDFNFGCPKHFSLSGGMGAALLDQPDRIEALLKTTVEQLDIPVTCKIRIKPELDSTIKLVRMIESCGVAAITVHGRTKQQRSSSDVNIDFIKEIAKTVKIPVIANGDSNNIATYQDMIDFRQRTTASSVMIARSAMKNPSVFRRDGPLLDSKTILQEFLKLAIQYDNPLANTKYSMQSMVSNLGRGFMSSLHYATDYESLCKLLEIKDCYMDTSSNCQQSPRAEAQQICDPDRVIDVIHMQKLCPQSGGC